MTYDIKCYELARVFLSDERKLYNEENIVELAMAIQETIDEMMEEMRKREEE